MECELCGEVIPPRRLEAMPHTRTCVGCADPKRISFKDLPGSVTIQHTGGLHEKYLKEEDAEQGL